MSENIKVGAVIYDPKVTVIWGIIADFFAKEGCPIEPVYYKDYKKQVEGLMAKEIDIAWNSPSAWLDAYLSTERTCLMGSTRDTAHDRQTYFITRTYSGIRK